MKERILANRYAKAMFSLAEEEHQMQLYRDQFQRLLEVCETSPDLLRILSMREMNADKKQNLLESLSQKLFLSPSVSRLLSLLLKRHKILLLSEIAESFELLVQESQNQLIALVKAANIKAFLPHQDILKAQLEKITGKSVQLKISEEPSLIGGLQVIVKDKIYEASLKGALEGIKENWI